MSFRPLPTSEPVSGALVAHRDGSGFVARRDDDNPDPEDLGA